MRHETYLDSKNGRMFTFRQDGVVLMSDSKNCYSYITTHHPPKDEMIYCGFYIV